MNKFICIMMLVFISGSLNAQTQRSATPAEKQAWRTATKMKDSLLLSAEQQNSIYDINMKLYQETTAIRKQYANNVSLITIHIQAVEDTRDSLYKKVLSDVQYIMYTKRKGYFLNGKSSGQ